MTERAIKSTQRTLRDFISKDEEKNIYVYTKVLSHLVNTWAEVRVLKLVYEQNAFSDSEKTRIIKSDGAKEKWEKTLKIAFSKRYDVAIKNINSGRVPITARTRYRMLLELIKKDLLESNQLRNRIAHGQWWYAFNSNLLRINGKLTGILRQENIVRLQLRLKMFISLAQIVQDLAVSKSTFERDFDNNFKIIEEQQRNFHNRRYDDYRAKMISKRRRGLERRNQAKSS